ncbi:MAG TPA: ferritin-like domain-containing protein, partial [Polyangia bacterium]
AVAALWLTDNDSLDGKLVLAAQCGDEARHFGMLSERLTAIGVDPLTFDARYGGYSKLFAFFRSLQTTEERMAAGFLTLGAYNGSRLDVLGAHARAKGDESTASLFQGPLKDDALTLRDAGRKKLLETATAEESQARARRAAFRTIELLGELQEPALARKYLSRSLKR